MTDTATQAPMLHLPPATLTALHRALAQDRAPADAAALTRQVGFESGEAFFQALQEWLGAGGTDAAAVPADEFWARFSDFFVSLGWGPLEHEQPHPGVASLSSHAWAEAEPGGETRQPTCHFTTGMLADLLGRIASADLAVMEVECRSRGDDRCRFLLGGSEALGVVFDRLRQGERYPAALEALG